MIPLHDEIPSAVFFLSFDVCKIVIYSFFKKIVCFLFEMSC